MKAHEPSRPDRGRLLTLLAASSLTTMSTAAIAPALPAIAATFGDGAKAEFASKILFTAPAISIVLSAPWIGWVVDRMGRFRVLVASLCLYVLAGSAGLYLNGLGALVLSRLALGLSVAGLMTSSTTMIGDAFSENERHRVMGMQAAFMGSGGVIFLLAGGLLAKVSWRLPFLVYAIAVFLLPAVLTFLRVPQSPLPQASLEQKPTRRLPPKAMVLLALAFMLHFAFYVVPLQVPFFLEAKGASASTTGFVLAVLPLSAAIVAALYSRLQAGLGFLGVLALTFAVTAIGLATLSVSQTIMVTVVAMLVIGLGMGLVYPNLMTWLMQLTTPDIRGRVVGGLTMAVFLGQFLSPAFSQLLTDGAGLSGSFAIVGSANALGFVALIPTLVRRASLRRRPCE